MGVALARIRIYEWCEQQANKKQVTAWERKTREVQISIPPRISKRKPNFRDDIELIDLNELVEEQKFILYIITSSKAQSYLR